MADRYFIDNEPALAARLDVFLGKLHRSLADSPFAAQIVVLLLGGGYGRGEGGVYRGSEVEGAALYNDLEFYVVTTGLRTPEKLPEWCHHWAEEGHRETGIEVEFKILPASALRQGQSSMFYYDLVLGHRLVWGDEGFCATLPESLSDPKLIPATEVTRLLFNRGTGLLFCREKLGENEAEMDSGFIERNHAKAWLALADAVLALNGRYHWSCQRRHSLLNEDLPLLPPDWPLLKKWHTSGVLFKLHPRHEFPGTPFLSQRQTEMTQVWLRTFLWAESVRLKRIWPEADAYASDAARIFPESSALKNVALRVRDRLRLGSRLPGLFDYPRAALQRALVLLLGSPENDSAIWRRASSLLGIVPTSTPAVVMSAYRTWWQRYN